MASIIHRKQAHHFKQRPVTPIFLFLCFALDMPLMFLKNLQVNLLTLVQQGFILPLQNQVLLVQQIQLYHSTEEEIYNKNILTLKNKPTAIPLHLRSWSQEYCCIGLLKLPVWNYQLTKCTRFCYVLKMQMCNILVSTRASTAALMKPVNVVCWKAIISHLLVPHHC